MGKQCMDMVATGEPRMCFKPRSRLTIQNTKTTDCQQAIHESEQRAVAAQPPKRVSSPNPPWLCTALAPPRRLRQKISCPAWQRRGELLLNSQEVAAAIACLRSFGATLVPMDGASGASSQSRKRPRGGGSRGHGKCRGRLAKSRGGRSGKGKSTGL